MRIVSIILIEEEVCLDIASARQNSDYRIVSFRLPFWQIISLNFVRSNKMKIP